MTLSIVTNMGSLIVQNNLAAATKSLNSSIERMTTGYRINNAADDAAGYAVATKFQTNLTSTSVAQDNVAMGSSLLSTLESTYDIMIAHFQRIRDLTEQAANGTYGADSIAAIKAEVSARLAEVDRLAGITEYNGIKLIDGVTGSLKDNGLNLQIGITSDEDTSVINLDKSLFAKADTATLLNVATATFEGYFTAGGSNYGDALDAADAALTSLTTKQTQIGAYQNRLDSAANALTVQFDNITSSLSTIKDADVAAESSSFIQAQILQQASATLLSTANQTPSIALNLI